MGQTSAASEEKKKRKREKEKENIHFACNWSQTANLHDQILDKESKKCATIRTKDE